MVEYEFAYHPRAHREAQKLPTEVDARIQRKLKSIVTDEFRTLPEWGAKPLSGTTEHIYRIEIGDYRAAFAIDAQLCVILAVSHRSNAYRDIATLEQRAAEQLE